MHGTALTEQQLERAIGDYIANAERPHISRFRGYLHRAGQVRAPPAESNGHGHHRLRRGERSPPQRYDYAATTTPEDVKWQDS